VIGPAPAAADLRPSSGTTPSMIHALREVFDRRDLLYMLAWRDIQVKYKQSIMGMLWAIFMPLVIVCAGLMVRYALAVVSGTPFSILDLTSVAVKAVPWAFFVSALRFGTNSMVANVNLVTKIYLPRLIFPLAAVLSQLFDFLVATAVVTLLLIVAGAGLSVHLLWLPLLIAPLVLLASALAIISSAGSLFFRDVKYIVEAFLTFAIFFTPVFYDSSLFGTWGPLLLINPVSPLLEGISATVIMHQSPSLPWLGYSGVVSVLLLILSLAVFKKLEPFFAESI
jgi:ABC-type polysaccharide/polyol phosphate export permease